MPGSAAAPTPPASVGSTQGASATGRASRLSRLSRLSQSLGRAAGSATKAARRLAPSGSAGVGAALDDADAARCHALLHLSEGGEASGQGGPAGAASPAPPAADDAFFSPASGSATIDVSGAALGSVSVNQPSRRRRWGECPSPCPRPLSALATTSAPSPELETHALLQRSQSATCLGDSFAVLSEGTPPSAGPGSGDVTSRRLSFSFGRRAGGAGDEQEEAGSPAPACQPFALSPELELSAASEPTPRLFAAAPAGGAAAAPPTAAAPAAPTSQPAVHPSPPVAAPGLLGR